VKNIVKILVFILIVSLGTSVYGAAPDKGRLKRASRHIIHRTTAVLMVAQQSALQGQRFYGLGLAIAHHRHSLKMFNHGSFEEAIYHSLRARYLGANVVKQNKNEALVDALYNRIEERFAARSPSADELDRRLPDNGRDDKTAVHEVIDSLPE
jgi:hypothetical protein